MNEETRKTKDRSPNFPFISLSTALRRAQEFYSEEKRGSAPFTVAAKHWNYSPASSGALQTVGALKSYGLMSDEGSGLQRKVRLTELALRILLDVRPDSTEKDAYLRQAALSAQIAAEVYAKWPEGLPSDANLFHYLVFDRKFAEAAARKVVKILKENEAFTGDSKSMVYFVSEDEGSDMGRGPMMEIQPRSSSGVPASTRTAVTPPALHMERLSLPDGTYVELRFSDAATWAAFDYLEQYAKFKKSHLPKPAATTQAPVPANVRDHDI